MPFSRFAYHQTPWVFGLLVSIAHAAEPKPPSGTTMEIRGALVASAALPAPVGASSAAAVPIVSTAPATGTIAPASSATSACSSVTSELDAVQARLPLLRAQKEAADLERAIRDANQAKASSPAESGPAVAMPTTTTPLPSGATTSASTTSKRVEAPLADLTLAGAGAFNGVWVATLMDGDGSAYDVQIGNVLPSGWKVRHIDPLSVVLERGRHRRTVTTAAGMR
ncbi:type IV pilus biogenesis protein PilP [Burkholderia glumae]|uniref:type IV pilus biogenesis protein PilP n=1 Tax=Burkholderia glumae TaxID=337 RepID=UPI002150D543|nr:type IV pilus biogenesis protein PilP [Burkholderia glumae]